MSIIELSHVDRNFKIAKREKNFFKYVFRRQFVIKEAVKDVSFQIEEGELVGFIGPNGAGKSTTIKMMTGILVPSGGTIKVLGKDPHENRKSIAKEIGVVFGQRSQLWWDLPVADTYLLLKRIYKIDDAVFEKNIETYSKLLDMESFINQPVRQLSLGQRMRADLCAALLHDPQIIFLDEPTIGLDVVVKKQIREMIKEINKTRNVTVILTTHDMKDVEEICDRIIMINSGKVVLDSAVSDIKHKFKGTSEIAIVTNIPVERMELEGVENIIINGCDVKIKFDSSQVSSASILTAVAKQYDIINVEIHEPEIDDIIRNLYSVTG